MRLEVFNRSKFRDGSAPGDDVPLVVPSVVYGIFDGATDPLGTVVDGIAAGRLAATVVASEMAALAFDPACKTLPGQDIIGRLSAVLKNRTDPLELAIPPSTTLAVAIDCGAHWRFMILGDSGIRLNGVEVFHREKLIDHVSTIARVAVFKDLSAQIADRHDVELLTRRCIFLGFDNAISEGVLSAVRAKAIVYDAIEATGLEDVADLVLDFLMGGIQTQHRFGNITGNPLCFDTMNGTTPKLNDLQDFERAKADVTSIEMFSDGYPFLPKDATVTAWEDAFQAAEDQDYHKTDRFATVKGSNRTEFFDDRSVIILG